MQKLSIFYTLLIKSSQYHLFLVEIFFHAATNLLYNYTFEHHLLNHVASLFGSYLFSEYSLHGRKDEFDNPSGTISYASRPFGIICHLRCDWHLSWVASFVFGIEFLLTLITGVLFVSSRYKNISLESCAVSQNIFVILQCWDDSLTIYDRCLKSC